MEEKASRNAAIAAYPPGFFFSPGTFFFCSAHTFVPSRLERTTRKSETLNNGASTSYEAAQRSTSSAGGLSEPL